MGVLSDLNKARKKATSVLPVSQARSAVISEAERLAESVGDEFVRQKMDAAKIGSLGVIDPAAIRAAQKAEAEAMRKRKQLLLKQERMALLEQAKLGDEIATRSRISKYGGRRSLLSAGETGFSGNLLQ